jgi:hypothetical protein
VAPSWMGDPHESNCTYHALCAYMTEDADHSVCNTHAVRR